MLLRYLKYIGRAVYAAPIALALLLVACANGPQPIQAAQQFHSSHGLVLATVPQDSLQDKVLLTTRGQADQISLQRQPELGPQAFGFWLPPGEYEMVGLKKPGGAAFAPIRVERGRITDLGAVITVPLGGYEFAVLAISHPEASAALEAAIRHLRPLLSSPEILHWRTDTLPAVQKTGSPSTGLGLIADLLMEYDRHVNKPSLNKLLREAKTVDEFQSLALTAVVPLTDEPAIDKQGALYYGAELGQLRRRIPSGQWDHIDTKTLQTITAVEVVGDRLVVGTGAGRIFARNGETQPWTQLAALDSSEAITDIDWVKDRWIVASASPNPPMRPPFARTFKSWKLYTSTQTNMSGLTPVLAKEFKEPTASYFGTVVRGQHLRDSDYYISSTEELLRLDLEGLTFSLVKPPQDAVTHFSTTQNGDMLTAFYAKGIFSKLHVSTDRGTTWKALSTPSYPVLDLVFDDPKNGRAAKVNMGAFTSTVEFQSYEAATDRWKKEHEAPTGCTRFLRDESSLQRICVTTGGSILNYVNGRWVAEFAVN